MAGNGTIYVRLQGDADSPEATGPPHTSDTEEEGTMPQQEQWQLSGNAAELYERYVVPYILGPWAPGLIALAALQQRTGARLRT